jgi:hypothetical protein
MKTMRICLISCLVIASSSFCSADEVGVWRALNERAVEAMSLNRAGAAEIGVRSSWDLPLTMPVIENLLAAPTSAVDTVGEKLVFLSTASGTAEVVSACRVWLETATYSVSESATPIFIEPVVFDQNIAPDVIDEAVKILSAMASSEKLCSRYVDSIPADKKGLLRKMLMEKLVPDSDEQPIQDDAQISQENGQEIPYSKWEAETFKTLEQADTRLMTAAACELAAKIEKIIPLLEKSAKSNVKSIKKLKSSNGKILISGDGDDIYTSSDIAGVSLIIDFGGDNRYECAPASADEKQVRVVIDFGENVTINSTGSAAGSGIMGIGMMYLPNPAGKKIIKAGDFSAGSGILGAGILSVAGTAEITGGSFCQGAGCFGIGLLMNKAGFRSAYKAQFLGQGAGMTQGIGIFLSSGDEISLEGGLSVSDFRENLGFTSLCQGVGYGMRAIAGGGIGIAVINGSSVSVNSSYFAQGSGYWHGLGLFYTAGDNAKIQARRYSQGAGVHTGFGAMFVSGDTVRTTNWGVGPAYGWDAGIGMFFGSGSENIYRADWACGHGEQGGHGIFAASGNGLKLSLPGLGSGTFRRNSASYGVAVLDGNDITFKSENGRFSTLASTGAGGEPFQISKMDPWGILTGKNIKFDEKLDLGKVDWPERKEAYSGNKASTVTPASQLRICEKWLHDGSIEPLLSIPDKDAGVLVSMYLPYNIEQLIALRSILASYGEIILPEIKSEIAASTGTGKLILAGHVSCFSAKNAVPLLMNLMDDPDWRVRSTAVRTMSTLYCEDYGLESGRATMLKESILLMKTGKPLVEGSKNATMWIDVIGHKSYGDIFALLSMSPVFTTEEKLKLYGVMPNILDLVNEKVRIAFGNFLVAHKDVYLPLFENELSDMKAAVPEVEKKLFDMIAIETDSVKLQIITAFGEMRLENRRELIMSYLDHPKAALREAAIASMARFGEDAVPMLKNKFKSSDDRTRALITTAPVTGWDDSLLKLVNLGLKDKSAIVRMTALSSAMALKPPLFEHRQKYLKDSK